MIHAHPKRSSSKSLQLCLQVGQLWIAAFFLFFLKYLIRLKTSVWTNPTQFISTVQVTWPRKLLAGTSWLKTDHHLQAIVIKS